MARQASKDVYRGKSDFGSRVGIVPFDTDLPTYLKVRCDAAGVLKFLPAGQDADTPVTTINVQAGEIIPWRIRKIIASGTTVAAGSVMSIEG